MTPPERNTKGTAHADPINPAHYRRGNVECIDAIEAAVEGLSGPDAVLVGNVIKYVWRFAHKNGSEDLTKAGWYLSRLLGRTLDREKAGKKPEGVPPPELFWEDDYR